MAASAGANDPFENTTQTLYFSPDGTNYSPETVVFATSTFTIPSTGQSGTFHNKRKFQMIYATQPPYGVCELYLRDKQAAGHYTGFYNCPHRGHKGTPQQMYVYTDIS